MSEAEEMKELMEKAAGFESSMAKLMGDTELQNITEYTRRQLAMLESEIARRKAEQPEGEGGFAV